MPWTIAPSQASINSCQGGSLTFFAHTFKHVLQGLKSVRSTGNVYALKLHNTNSVFGQFHMRVDKIQIFKEVAHVIIPCSTFMTS